MDGVLGGSGKGEGMLRMLYQLCIPVTYCHPQLVRMLPYKVTQAMSLLSGRHNSGVMKDIQFGTGLCRLNSH